MTRSFFRSVFCSTANVVSALGIAVGLMLIASGCAVIQAPPSASEAPEIEGVDQFARMVAGAASTAIVTISGEVDLVWPSDSRWLRIKNVVGTDSYSNGYKWIFTCTGCISPASRQRGAQIAATGRPYNRYYFGYERRPTPQSGATVSSVNEAFTARFGQLNEYDAKEMNDNQVTKAMLVTYPPPISISDAVILESLKIPVASYLQWEAYFSPAADLAPASWIIKYKQEQKPAGFWDDSNGPLANAWRSAGVENFGFVLESLVPIPFYLAQVPAANRNVNGIDLEVAAAYQLSLLRDLCQSFGWVRTSCEDTLRTELGVTSLKQIPAGVALEMVRMFRNTSYAANKRPAVYLMRNELSEGSFSDYRSISYLAQTHRLFVTRVSTEADVVRTLERIGTRFGNIDFVVLAGHGNATELQLSPGNSLTRTSDAFFTALRTYAIGATVLLNSCATGQAVAGQENFAQTVIRRANRLREVVAAVDLSSGAYLWRTGNKFEFYFGRTGKVRLTPPAWQNPNLAGDVNNDGSVTAGDLLTLMYHENLARNAGYPALGERRASDMYFDVNGDNVFNNADLLLLTSWVR